MKEPSKPEVAVPTSVCPNPKLWHCYDDMATELEVLDFLTTLVIMLKPQRLIETGCYHGHGTEAIAIGMKGNERGILHTCDLQSESVLDTERRLLQNGLKGRVVIYQQSGVELIKFLPEPIDFAFLDSGADEVRCDELRALYPKLSPGAVVAVHDTGVHTFIREKYLPPLLRELEMQHIFFDTPRGLCLCRKKPEIYP